MSMTNPQKELAESLPLCSPNDDYLKDFSPMPPTGEFKISITFMSLKIYFFFNFQLRKRRTAKTKMSRKSQSKSYTLESSRKYSKFEKYN